MKSSKILRTNIGLVSLIVFLWFMASAGQILKYFHGKAPLVWLAGVVCITVLLIVARAVQIRLKGQISWVWLAAFFVVIATVYLIVYPITQRHPFGPGSDSENATLTADTQLLQHHFPYYHRTYLNTPITPMPGSLLLSMPFLFLGRVSYQTLFWLGVLVIFCAGYFRYRTTALAFLATMVLGNAGVLDEIVVGADYALNAIYISIATWWLIRAHEKDTGRQRWLAAIFLGVALSSRAIYVVIPPLVFAYLMQRKGIRTALQSVGLSAFIALAITLPFYFYDPAHFSPLYVVGKLNFLPPPVRHVVAVLLPALAMLISFTGFLQRLTLPRIYLLAGLATGIILIPTEIIQLFAMHFSQAAWLEMEYVSSAALFLCLWAFYRLEERNLVNDPLAKHNPFESLPA
jgi:hypothetical protein